MQFSVKYADTGSSFGAGRITRHDSSINALETFINRRSKPNTLVSDCGSSFEGVIQELNLEHPELNQDKITNIY